ncbi:MAG TPA: hypothetical protein VM711_11050 [Sphingomicrobium sp.]|nr:hypothetical protein [Sphingomicrobium sp.]
MAAVHAARRSCGELQLEAKEALMSARQFAVVMALLLILAAVAGAQTPMQIFGAWHCTADFCTWATAEDSVTFDNQNHWMIDRNMNNTYHPSVNLVVFSFVQPVKLMNLTTDSGDTNGIPTGMNSAAVQYFESRGVRVIFSIGGVTYTGDWDTALATNPTALGLNAANAAKQFNVGIEIDYENSSNPNLSGLASFVNAYRSVIPYDPTGNNPAARLTIDLGAGDQYLSGLASYATSNWLTTTNPVLDYANAMVVRAGTSVSSLESDWSQHIDGYPTLNVAPLAPAKLTGSFFLVNSKPIANCVGPFSQSQQAQAANFVETVAPAGAGTTPGMLGLMFWAAGCQGTHTACTFPPNTCQNGMGVSATNFNIPVPMPALRQQ